MQTRAKQLIKIIPVILIAVGLCIYIYFSTKSLIQGPRITVESIEDNQTFTAPLIDVSGKVANIANLTLNDNKIFIDNKGNFEEKLLLLPGYNIIKLRAEDQFGKVKEEILHIYLERKEEITIDIEEVAEPISNENSDLLIEEGVEAEIDEEELPEVN